MQTVQAQNTGTSHEDRLHFHLQGTCQILHRKYLTRRLRVIFRHWITFGALRHHLLHPLEQQSRRTSACPWTLLRWLWIRERPDFFLWTTELCWCPDLSSWVARIFSWFDFKGEIGKIVWNPLFHDVLIDLLVIWEVHESLLHWLPSVRIEFNFGRHHKVEHGHLPWIVLFETSWELLVIDVWTFAVKCKNLHVTFHLLHNR